MKILRSNSPVWFEEVPDMIHTETTEAADEFERRRHYQNMKKDLLIASLGTLPTGDWENRAVERAKKWFRSITEERWGSEPVEGSSE